MGLKTASEIQGDVLRLLNESAVATSINGGIYRSGQRPANSRQEDVVIIFTEGNAAQIQTGTLTIHVYVPDVDFEGNGIYREDGKRIDTLSRVMQDWVDALPAGDYLYRLKDTVHSIVSEAPSKQHIIVVRLGFNYNTEL